MKIKAMAAALPEYANDLRLNLDLLLEDDSVADARKFGLLLACAHATGHKPLVDAAEADCVDRISAQTANAARAAAAVMAMNNVFYRFTEFTANRDYATLPVKLRMRALGSPGIDRLDFELFCVAVSAMNGCPACINAHEPILARGGVAPEMVLDAVRLGAVLKAMATVHAALNGNEA